MIETFELSRVFFYSDFQFHKYYIIKMTCCIINFKTILYYGIKTQYLEVIPISILHIKTIHLYVCKSIDF